MKENVLLFVRNYFSLTFGFVVIFASIVYVATSPRGVLITDQFFDSFRTTNMRDEVRIVGIDDESLQAFGAWPWDRNVFADLTTKLDTYGVKIIAYDILFLEARAGDVAFRDALLTTQSKIIFASKIDNEKHLTSFLGKGAKLSDNGLANVIPDSDGKVRKYPTSRIVDGVCVNTLAQKAFFYYTHKTEHCENNRTLFRYPLSIQTISVKDVIKGTVPEGFFKNKVVFIGSTSLDLEDHFVGMGGEKIGGVFVHASIFSSLLNGVADKNLSSNHILLILFVYGILFVVFLYRTKTPFTQFAVVAGSIIIILLATVGLFSRGYIAPFPWLITESILLGAYVALFRFIKERKQNQYIRSLFSKYVHKDVLKELMKSSSSLRFDGEKRNMTILFSDIRGFTSFSEIMSPEELTKLLNAYLSAMTPPIFEEKGTIDKFIGDAVMAFWNAPLFVHNHPTHAVRAALRMEQSLKLFNVKHNSNLAMGIGVHVGDVVVGNVGSEDRVNYTVLGDAVNLASRIEGLTKKYAVGCIVTEEVKERVTDNTILFRKLDTITVKGKITPTVLYEAHSYDKEVAHSFVKYEEALGYYEVGEFDKAENLFKELVKNGDGPSTTMLEHISISRNDKEWQGVWHFDEK